MMIVEIIDGHVHRIYPEYSSMEAIKGLFAPNIHMEEAPDEVREGWIFDSTKSGESRFTRPPIPEGWEYDSVSGLPIPPPDESSRYSERRTLHELTDADTMQALRKIREGDTSIDWSAWLAALDAYNMAIEETTKQEGYPQKVIYPVYPEKPTI